MIAAVTVVLLASSLFLIPVAIWLAVRWALIAPAIALERLSAFEALRRSSRLVRRNWLKVGSLTILGAAVALVAGPLVGSLLIFVTNAPLTLLDVVAGIIYAVTMPFVALTTAYVYFDVRVRDELAGELGLGRAARGDQPGQCVDHRPTCGREAPLLDRGGERLVVALVLVGVRRPRSLRSPGRTRCRRPGTRRSRSGRPSVRARGRALLRTAAHTPSLPARAGSRRRRCPSSRGTGGRSSRASVPSRPLTRIQPEEDVARRLHQALPDHDAPAVVVVLALADEPLEHRGLGLLRLEEQWVLLVSPDEEVDPGARADAADADDLAGGVDVLELLDRMVVIGERAPVLLDQRAHQLLRVVARACSGRTSSSIGTISGGSGTIRSLPSISSVRFAKTLMLSRVRGLRDVLRRLLPFLLAEPLRSDLGADPAHHLLDVHVVVPRLERPEVRRVPHHQPVLADAGHDHDAPVGGGEAALAAEHLDAGGEALHVPFPRAGKRLVEVVDVEQDLALGGAEEAEVRQVRVAAELDVDARARGRSQIGGHDERRATVERERRVEHPSVPDRHELGHPALGLLLEQRDRVGPVGRWLPGAVGRSRRRLPRLLAAGDALLHGQMHVPPGPRESRGAGGTGRTVGGLRAHGLSLSGIRTEGKSDQAVCPSSRSRTPICSLRR